MRKYWLLISRVPFEFIIGVIAVIASISYFADLGVLNNIPVATVYGLLLARIWNVVYLVSGIALMVGIAKMRRDIETFGLFWLMGGTFLQMTGIFLDPGVPNQRAFSAITVLIASIMRVCLLLSHKDTIVVDTKVIPPPISDGDFDGV